jgi:hypothetical protein
MRIELFHLFIRTHLPVLRTVTLHLSYVLHCLFILSLLEFHFFHGGVQFLSQGSSKGYLLFDVEVHLVLYMLHMDIGRPACSLREMSILRSVQELIMA